MSYLQDVEHLLYEHGIAVARTLSEAEDYAKHYPEIVHGEHVQAHEDGQFIGPPHEHP